MSEHIVPTWDRVKQTSRIARLRIDADRCAARTKAGHQCNNGLWGGEAGGHYEINGVKVPLCTLHFRIAQTENW